MALSNGSATAPVPSLTVTKPKKGFESELVKRHYYKLINEQFRQLQLDSDLQSKSIFDLIDYCELLYEKSSDHLHLGERGLQSYIRGYLTFNYFINSFIMLHFGGFDQFIKTNEYDFIIYLNVFAFYNTDETVSTYANLVPLKELRALVLDYLDDKKLLKFDVHELYAWLYEYIAYLKQKEGGDSDGGSDGGDSGAESGDSDSDNSGEKPFTSRSASRSASVSDLTSTLQHVALSTDSFLDLYGSDSDFQFDSVKKPARKPPPPVPTQLPPALAQRQPPYPREPPQVDFAYSRSNTSLENLDYKRAAKAQNRLSMPVAPPGYGLPHSATSPPYAGPVTQFAPSYQVPYYQFSQPPPQPYQPPQQYQPPYQPPQQYYAPVAQPVVYQAPQPTAQRLAHMQRRQAMRDNAVCGLKNFGSSCYINSTIQLLFGIRQFKSVFTSQEYRSYIRDPRFVAAMRAPSKSKAAVLLSDAVASLLNSFVAHGGTAIAPTKFIRVSSLLKPDLNIPYEQQDSQEFLLFILDRLHEELSSKGANADISRSMFDDYIRAWNIQIKPHEKDEYFKWYTGLVHHEGNSPIHDMFQGHLQNKLICDQCGHESTNYSPFTILSLPIPDNSRGKVVDLSECLRYYTQDEILTGDNAWNCPKCHKQDRLDPNVLDTHPVFNNKRSGIFKFSRRSKSPAKDKKAKPPVTDTKISISTKRLSFIKLPQVLFIHLSRFSMYNLTDKLDTVIAYPLKLNFNNYSSEGRTGISYKLSGVINHYGNLKSGHYTSLINKSAVNQSRGIDNLIEPFWCDFDDENVRCGVSYGDLRARQNLNHHSKDVYVLCYERI